ncbi:MAG: CaiB/BaiF CoA-transferase family protein [Chloroflexota bacterium]|nr:CaiB/BaiF CoA-transferase family protein [Chloroflexota bacterium]
MQTPEPVQDNLAVIDLGERISGPFCAKLFAALGAEVIKVEPPEGEPSRRAGPFPGDIPHPEKSGEYLYLNMGKKGVTLNLRTATGRDLFLKLATGADILIENSPPGSISSLGLGYPVLHKLNPGLVVASITPFGQYGPYCNYKCDEIGVHAASGEMYLAGEPDREPLKKGGSIAQYFGGFNAFLGCMMALWVREETGEGQHVDVSLAECFTSNIGGFVKQAAYTGASPTRQGNSGRPWPRGFKRCQDGYILWHTVPGADWWPSFKEMLSIPELDEERFSTPESRAEHQQELDTLFQRWLLGHRKEELFHSGQKRRLAFGHVATAPDLMASAQLKHRNFFVEMDHPVAGSFKYPGGPFKSTETPWRDSRSPLLGEHNEEVLCGRLGLSLEELAVLRRAGAV